MERGDEWKAGGECSKCRREAYCNKKCKAAQKRSQVELGLAVGCAFAKVYARLHGVEKE